MSGEAHYPLRRMMGFALVALGWRPGDFWAATPCELQAALDYFSGADRQRAFEAFKRSVEDRQAQRR